MADEWFVGRQGTRSGPYPTDVVRRMVAAGEIRPGDLVWREGMADWVPLSSVPGLGPAPATSPVPLSAAQPMSDNPYAAPSAVDFPVEVITTATGGPFVYADFLSRVAAALIDGVVLLVAVVTSMFAIGAFFGVMSGGDLESVGAAVQGCGQLAGIIIGVTYYVVLESSVKQGTWGKQLLGIKVTDMQGNRISGGRALGRYFARFITNCTFGIGYLTPLFTEQKQTVHDMICGCLALRK